MASVGRNEPCPCGSGRKYKHCHLREHARAALEASVEEEEAPVEDSLSDEEVAARQAAFEDGPTMNTLGVVLVGAALVSLAVGMFTSSTYGWLLFGLVLLGVCWWAALRKPPPPRDESDNPATINFGK